ncbi:MAG: ribosome-associated translation inhibitor RaiA [Prolixibacteraceae bacterium]
MDVKVQTVHFKADQKLIDFCEKRLNKLDQFFDSVIGAEVMLKLEKDEERENKVSEIKLSVPSNDPLFAKKQAKTFEEAIDLTVEALKKQMEKYKTKTSNK